MKKRTAVKIAASLMGVMMLNLTGCAQMLGNGNSVPKEKMESFASTVGSLADIDAPDNARIIGFGEAAHGNKEFQRMKLDIFKDMVETENVRCFALEADMAGCKRAEKYTLYDQGTGEEATRAVGFSIYRTDEIKALLEWIHDYNQGKEMSEKIRFVGFDSAYSEDAVKCIKEFYDTYASEKAADYNAKLDTYFVGEYVECTDKSLYKDVKALVEEIVKDLQDHEKTYVEKIGQDEFDSICYIAKGLSWYLDKSLSGTNDRTARDTYMAETVKWLLEREEKRGYKMFVSAHNGHVAKINTIAGQKACMGSLLTEAFGDAYYVVGSDYYESDCSFPGNNGRVNHKLGSDDPLAYQVQFLDTNECYLDFDEVEKNSEIGKYVFNTMTMGSLGEEYSVMMEYLVNSREINAVPDQMYDGMVFVYEATPIDVWPRIP